MPSVPLWLLGRHCTVVSAALQKVDPTTGALMAAGGTGDTATLAAGSGSLAAGTFAFSVGVVDGIEYNGAKTTEQISSISDTHSNYVPIAFRDGFSLTELLRTTAGSSLLASLWAGGSGATNSSRIVFLTFERGGKKWDGYFLMTGYSESIRRGRSTGRMTLEMVDPGQNNAAYRAGSF